MRKPITAARRRLATAVVAITGGALALSACAPAVDEGTDEDLGGFTYWSWFQAEEPAADAIRANVKEFSEETGIEVKLEFQGRSLLDKLQPTLATDPAADLFEQPPYNVKTVLYPVGAVAELTDVLDSEIPGEGVTVRDVIPEKIVDFGSFEGGTYLLPTALTGYTLWYNEANIQPDASVFESWDSFLTYLDERKAEGVQPIALDGDIPGYNTLWFTLLAVNAMGAGSVHEAAADTPGEAWEEPAFLRAAQQVEMLASGDYFIDGYGASKFPGGQVEWADNTSDFMLMGSWLPTEVGEYQAEGFSAVAVPFPNNGYSGATQAAADGNGFVVAEKSENKEAVAAYIAWSYQKEKAERYSNTANFLPVRDDVAPPASLESSAEILREADVFYTSTDGLSLDYGDFNTKVFQPLNSDLILGNIDAETFIDQLKAKSAEYWKLNS